MLLENAVLAASMLLAAQDRHFPKPLAGAPSVMGSADEEIRSLALNLDHAIKACSEQSARVSAGRKEVGRAEKTAINAGMLSWISNPPAVLVAQAKGRPARYGRWFDPHATIFMIAYDAEPSCRILVGDSLWADTVRPALYAKIQDDHFWKLDGPEQAVGGDSVRATFHADLPGAVNVRPLISVAAPASPKEGGIRLSVGVHMVKKGENK